MRGLKLAHILNLSAASVAIAACSPVWAQDAGASGSGDIIVTARRVEEKLQDVPISITVYSQEQLSNRNMVNAEDLAKTTPGLQVNNNVGSENSVFALRGFTQDIGTQPTVGVYFADVVALRGGSNGNFAGDGAGAGSLFDLQNVQVLKGPQGTLQGRNTTGGAVLLVPQKPTDKLEGYVEAGAGNYNSWGVQGVLNVPLSENVRLRLGVDHQSRKGYMNNLTNIGPRDFNDLDYTAVRASLVANLTPSLENYTVFSYSNSHTNGITQKLISVDQNGPLTALVGAMDQLVEQSKHGFFDVFSIMPDAMTKTRKWQVINTTTWLASDNLTVKNIISYGQLRQLNNQQLFGSHFFLTGPISQQKYAIYSNMQHSPVGQDNSAQSTFTEELRFSGHGADGKLDWQGGFYFEKASPLGTTGVQTVSFGNCTNIAVGDCFGIGGFNTQVAQTTNQDVAVYAQATYKLTSQLSLTGGFRYTWDKMTSSATEEFNTDPVFTPDLAAFATPSTKFCIYNWSPAPAAGCPTVNLTKKSHAPTWLIDLDYKPTPDILIYAKYSRGYRAGGVKNDAPNLGLLVPGAPNFQQFEPEKLDAYEIGLKSSFHGAVSGTFNVAGFYNKFSNQQVSEGLGLVPGFGTGKPTDPIVGGPPTSAPVNIGKSRIYGVDVDLALNLFQGFTVTAGYEYLNSRVTAIQSVAPVAFQNATLFPQPLAVIGQPLPLSPENKFTINGTYTLPLDSSVGKISVGLTFTHTDSQKSSYADAATIARDGPQFVAGNGVVVQNNTDFGVLQPTDLLDINVNWKNVLGQPVDLTFWATNLTNQHYYTWVPGLLGYGYEVAALGAPRMWGFKAKVHF